MAGISLIAASVPMPLSPTYAEQVGCMSSRCWRTHRVQTDSPCRISLGLETGQRALALKGSLQRCSKTHLLRYVVVEAPARCSAPTTVAACAAGPMPGGSAPATFAASAAGPMPGGSAPATFAGSAAGPMPRGSAPTTVAACAAGPMPGGSAPATVAAMCSRPHARWPSTRHSCRVCS